MTTSDEFSVAAETHASQLRNAAGSALEVVEVEGTRDPRTVVVPSTPDPAGPKSPDDVFREEMAAATTLPAVKAALLKRFS